MIGSIFILIPNIYKTSKFYFLVKNLLGLTHYSRQLLITKHKKTELEVIFAQNEYFLHPNFVTTESDLFKRTSYKTNSIHILSFEDASDNDLLDRLLRQYETVYIDDLDKVCFYKDERNSILYPKRNFYFLALSTKFLVTLGEQSDRFSSQRLFFINHGFDNYYSYCPNWMNQPCIKLIPLPNMAKMLVFKRRLIGFERQYKWICNSMGIRTSHVIYLFDETKKEKQGKRPIQGLYLLSSGGVLDINCVWRILFKDLDSLVGSVKVYYASKSQRFSVIPWGHFLLKLIMNIILRPFI